MEVVIVAPPQLRREIVMNVSVNLRRAQADQANKYADAESIPHCFSYGDAPVVCFFPYQSDSRHGNFLDRSYQAVHTSPEWRKRLTKVHTLGKRLCHPLEALFCTTKALGTHHHRTMLGFWLPRLPAAVFLHVAVGTAPNRRTSPNVKRSCRSGVAVQCGSRGCRKALCHFSRPQCIRHSRRAAIL